MASQSGIKEKTMQAKSNSELLKVLVGCGASYFQGECISEMLNTLANMPEEQYNGQSNYPAMRKRLEALLEVLERSKKEAPSLHEGTVINQSSKVASHFIPLLQDEKQEHFYAVILDNKYRIIEKKLITLGTLNRSLVHPREIFAPAVELRAAAVMLVHNHPSGNSKASHQDVEITKRLCEVGKIIGINVVDHVIIGKDEYFSFVDEELM